MTATRVRDVVQRLGYVRDISAANLARHRQYRFAILLPDRASQFLQSLREAIAEASRAWWRIGSKSKPWRLRFRIRRRLRG